MGILNLTPDSFSDGGRWTDRHAAVNQVQSMLQQGAGIIDVGGESTRPGAERIAADEQIRRVGEVIEAIAQMDHPSGRSSGPVVVSIDTTQAAVAEAALDRGASIINDVSAGREDPYILDLAADRGVPIVLMHMQGQPGTMQKNPTYDDVVSDIENFLLDRVAAALDAGVSREQIVIDPGIGFGKTREHNLKLMANLDRFVATGYPVLLGASRKRFMGSLLQRQDGSQPAPHELVAATCATTCVGVAAGVQMFRVHDVEANFQAAQVAFAVKDTNS